MRVYHELRYHDKSAFVTITYNDDNLPENASLVKSDIQKYLKRVRKRFPERKIRYFLTGEYGDRTQRPHYHLILLGVGLEDKYALEDCWKKGYSYFGIAEQDSIRYVCQYIDKKFSGDKAVEEYNNKGREPVFKTCSKGFGERFIQDNERQLKENLYINFAGVKHNLPKYYLDKLGISEEDRKLLKLLREENERDFNQSKNNLFLSHDELYKSCSPEVAFKHHNGLSDWNSQHDRNLKARAKIKILRKHKYVI